jgi:hypothetical protein
VAKIITANIEGDLHVDDVSRFFAERDFDILCVQEVFECDISDITGPSYHTSFLPMCLKVHKSGELRPVGIALASKVEPLSTRKAYYYEASSEIVLFDVSNKRKTISHGLIAARFSWKGQLATIINTHFTWTPNGVSDEAQDEDIQALLALVKEEHPHVLCGDFNIPRYYNKHFETLAGLYTDNIPPNIESSIYLPLHAAAKNPDVAERLARYMVDYLFSTRGAYLIQNVERHGGLSDHYFFSAVVDLD